MGNLRPSNAPCCPRINRHFVAPERTRLKPPENLTGLFNPYSLIPVFYSQIALCPGQGSEASSVRVSASAKPYRAK